MRLTDTSFLHGAFRHRLALVATRLIELEIPLELYEGARTPWRQAELYARGRTVPGTRTVTRAKAWQSLHQYGLAADFVFRASAGWTWDEPRPGMWDRYHEVAKGYGLDVLSFERPHIQFPWALNDLRRGFYPDDGGPTWRMWLGDQVERWGQYERDCAGAFHPGAPPPFDLDERPLIAEPGHLGPEDPTPRPFVPPRG